MELKNGTYSIQGVKLLDVAKEFGTPVYVYDADKILQQYNRLVNAFTGVDVKIKYASKALTNISVLKLLQKAGAGIDAVSINEVKLAKKAGHTANNIIYTPNCVSFDEVVAGVEEGVLINIDNLPFLEEFGKKYGNSHPVCVRINPHIQAGGNANIQVGHVGSKFGISYLQFHEAQELVKKYNLNVTGLHVHTGSDILEAEVFLKVAKLIFEIAEQFDNLEFIDFGSGFKVAYKDDDVTTDIEDLGAKMSEAFNAFCERYGKKLEMWFEPGKFLVSESGVFLASTNLVKTTPACVFVGLDTGFNHLIRPMMYDSYHRIDNISNPEGKKHVYNIVGYICETDTFAHERQLNEVRVGDVLAFRNAGAYGFMMSSNFNSRLRPAEVMIYNGKAHLIRERETFDDLIKGQVEIDL